MPPAPGSFIIPYGCKPLPRLKYGMALMRWCRRLRQSGEDIPHYGSGQGLQDKARPQGYSLFSPPGSSRQSPAGQGCPPGRQFLFQLHPFFQKGCFSRKIPCFMHVCRLSLVLMGRKYAAENPIIQGNSPKAGPISCKVVTWSSSWRPVALEKMGMEHSKALGLFIHQPGKGFPHCRKYAMPGPKPRQLRREEGSRKADP